MPEINLARVVVTKHAAERWRERTGQPGEDLGASLRAAVVPTRGLARRVMVWMARGCRSVDQGLTAGRQLRVDWATGAVFLLKREGAYASGEPCWCLVTVTTLALVQEAEACPAATA